MGGWFKDLRAGVSPDKRVAPASNPPTPVSITVGDEHRKLIESLDAEKEKLAAQANAARLLDEYSMGRESNIHKLNDIYSYVNAFVGMLVVVGLGLITLWLLPQLIEVLQNMDVTLELQPMDVTLEKGISITTAIFIIATLFVLFSSSTFRRDSYL